MSHTESRGPGLRLPHPAVAGGRPPPEGAQLWGMQLPAAEGRSSDDLRQPATSRQRALPPPGDAPRGALHVPGQVIGSSEPQPSLSGAPRQ